jgi:hypothetical protein
MSAATKIELGRAVTVPAYESPSLRVRDLDANRMRD